MKISFETAKLAKEKGFDELCSHFYENGKITNSKLISSASNSAFVENLEFIRQSAPTQAVLQKWLRETKSRYVQIYPLNTLKFQFIIFFTDQELLNSDSFKNLMDFNNFDTYEEALEAGLQEALKQI